MKKLTKPIILKTRRTCIRPFTLKDYNSFKERIDNLPPSKNKHDLASLFPKDTSKKGFREFMKGSLTTTKKKEYIDLAIYNKKTDEWLGSVYLYHIRKGSFQKANIDYFIFSPFWKKGYGKEACKKVIDYAFNTLKLKRIEATIIKDNIPSIRLAMSIGMLPEGIRRSFCYYMGKKRVDVKVFAIVKY
ncbi:MAG: GNAT family N-acetyltransferase [Ignavibacteria bacterium]|nr:GNAT family N-acetyltransferase [Ignavibacteria bacterium]